MSNKSVRCLRCQKKLDPFDVTEDSNGLCLECGVALRDSTMAREAKKSAPKNLIPAGVKNAATGIFLTPALCTYGRPRERFRRRRGLKIYRIAP
jgi:hypothetical protein